MIVHVVLFRPKPDLSAVNRQELIESLGLAARDIPSVRRFRVGRRVMHSLPGYEQLMRDDYEYAAIIEFDDLEGLKAYLRHPSHTEIGRHFTASAAQSLAYDYDVRESGITDPLVINH